MASVELRNLEKAFGSVGVIHGINLAIADGEFIALVGPSGCGKSTILRMIAGLEGSTVGDIDIGGTVVNEKNPRERNVAMVFQNYALYPHMTVAENISFNLRLSGLPKVERSRRVDEAARLLELSDLLERRPAQLSGGQRQRVAMGRALVRDPAVFLFDEPLSNLDAKLRVQMRAEIKTLHQKVRTTSIYVTHDQIEAMTLADRVVVLNKGRIEQAGTPIELYRNPANAFVAGFIGSPSMNFLDAVVATGGNGPTARLADGTLLRVDPRLPLAEGHPVKVGIRPEHLVPGGAGTRLSGTTELVEPTGAQTHVTFKLAGSPVTAVIDGAVAIAAGQAFHATIRPELIHLFEPGSGQRLTGPGPTSEPLDLGAHRLAG